MDVTASLSAEVEPQVLYEAVSDLGNYPDWFEIVTRAEPAEPDAGDPGPAWSVDLRGRVGPLSRSKRLRIVRSTDDPPHLAVFERRELDGRSHSDWVMRARLGTGDDPGHTVLTMELHYGGTMWVPMLDRILSEEIQRSRQRLLAVLGHDR